MNSFSLETHLRLSASQLELMVDAEGRTHFDVFRTLPAAALRDWPDFVDLPSRYWEACAMVESVVGRPVATVHLLRQGIFSLIHADGLAYRPDTAISSPIAELYDQSRLLYALVTWSMHEPDNAEIKARLRAQVDGLRRLATFKGDYAYINKIGIYFGGTLIRPLQQAGIVLADSHCRDFARALARGILDHTDKYAADGSFSGQVNSRMDALAGILVTGLLDDDNRIIRRVRDVFEYAHAKIGTSFGWVPEVAQRQDDLTGCETCGIQTTLDVALLLARHVDENCWDAVERTVRNQLVENQIGDRDWLDFTPIIPDEDIRESCLNTLHTDLGRRIAGGFAGWSSPQGLLAYEETLWPGWVKNSDMYPRYLGRVRAMQNCCSGSGPRALWEAWTNIARFEGKTLIVNMLIDKQIQGAKVLSSIPFEGKARIELDRDCDVRFRIPGSAPADSLVVLVESKARQYRASPEKKGRFLSIGGMLAGDSIEIRFAQPPRIENFTIGNPGCKKYQFEASWLGDTVVAMKPDPKNSKTGYSFIEGRQVRTFYSTNAIGKLYQRQSWLKPQQKVVPSPTTLDRQQIDWYSLKRR